MHGKTDTAIRLKWFAGKAVGVFLAMLLQRGISSGSYLVCAPCPREHGDTPLVRHLYLFHVRCALSRSFVKLDLPRQPSFAALQTTYSVYMAPYLSTMRSSFHITTYRGINKCWCFEPVRIFCFFECSISPPPDERRLRCDVKGIMNDRDCVRQSVLYICTRCSRSWRIHTKSFQN